MNLEDKLREIRTEYLHRMTQGDNRLLQQVESHVTARQGKMLRPRLLLLAADTLGQTESRRTLLLATCMEMLHNASLLHDDVIDHAVTRRGMASVNSRWSDAVAILVGDFILTQVMRLLAEVNESDTTALISDTVMQMVDAELLAQENGNEPDESTYLKIIDGKTALLFSTAARLGNPAYTEFGLHYGRLFQLYDDLRDGEAPLFAETLIHQEKEAIDHLKEAGITLPLEDPASIMQ